MDSNISNWLVSKKVDLVFIFLPIWAVLIYCFTLPSVVIDYKLSITFWVVFILGIDVSHVWSTIFRTYFDKEERQQYKKLLIFAPLVAFGLVSLLCLINEYLFWSVLAYFALYHFVKQQYGFFVIYKRKSRFDETEHFLKSKWMLLIGVLYPVLYWHLCGNRTFFWFNGGDFVHFNNIYFSGILKWASYFYLLIHLLWLLEIFIKSKKIPFGLVLWIVSSSLIWYIGIVWFNSDVVFSLTNVVAHGIPYMVLVFFYIEKKKSIKTMQPIQFSPRLIVKIGLMLSVILVFAFSEEYLWDWLVYKEKGAFFQEWIGFPFMVEVSVTMKVILIAILSVPQITHYILDGYIWKGKNFRYKIF
jgi:hypothetical protein